jgi:hypothetical protein
MLDSLVAFVGQSNALGFGLDGDDLPEDYGKVDPSTFIWNNAEGGWEVMRPGVNTGTPNNPGAWGPEVAFAAAWRKAHAADDGLYIVKSARGSTGLAHDPAPGVNDWSPDSAGELFDATRELIDAARATLAGRAAGVEAVFVMQGEEDGFSRAKAEAYGESFARFRDAVRDRWMDDGAGKIGWGWIDDASTPHGAEVRRHQAQADAADPHGLSFETADLPMQNDGLHYSAAGHIGLGERFYTLYDDWF